MAFFSTDVLHSDVPVDFLCTYLLDIQLNFASVTLNREGTTTEFHSSTSRTPLVDY